MHLLVGLSMSASGKETMDAKVMDLAGQAEIVKNAVADRAVAVIEQYRQGKYHGREVSTILAELFEAANDTVERMVVDAALKANT